MYSCYFGVLSLLLVSTAFALDFNGFEPLPDPPQDFSKIEFGLTCPTDLEFVGTVNVIQWTVEPVTTESIVISTNPPGLVDASAEDGVLRFNYNDVSLSMHEEGAGVRIQVPKDQLEGITGAPDTAFSALVLEGFTRLSSIVQEAHGAIFVVYVNNTSEPIQISDSGRSNNILIGTNVKVNAMVSGQRSVVTIDGVLETGTLSGTDALLWAVQGIEQLVVSGPRNRIFTSDRAGAGCARVEVQTEPNACVLTTLAVPAPPSTVLSTSDITLTCSATKAESPGSAAWKPVTRNTVSWITAAAWIWHSLS